MLESHVEIPDLVEEMRSAFDRSFEMPSVPPDSDVERFLAITASGAALALRFSDLDRVEARSKMISLPSGNRSLLGLMGLRGQLVPVFSLAAFLGINPPESAWRWVALCGGEAPMGLAFESIQCQRAIRRSEILPQKTEGTLRQHVHHASLEGGQVLQIVDVLSIRRAAGQGAAVVSEAKQEQ